MNLRKLTKAIIAPAVMSLAVGAGPANAAILLNNWTLDIGAAIGGLGQIKNINTFNFAGLFAAVTTPGAPLGPIGDIVSTDFLINVTAKNGNGFVLTTTGKIMGLDFQLTGVGESTQIATAATPDGLGGFTVTSAITGGTLDIYLDTVVNAVVLPDPAPGAGTGMHDGLLIASFSAIAFEGGALFGTTSLNGSQDITFKLVSALPNVLLDSSGIPLALGSLLAVTDADTDSDDDNNGFADTSISGVGGPLAAVCTKGALKARCGTEDGSFRISATVPEPSTLAIMGAGLLAMGGVRRRAKG